MSQIQPGQPDPLPSGMPAAPEVPKTTGVPKAGYWIAGLIYFFGCGGAIIWFLVILMGTATSLMSMPSDFARVDIPGTATVLLDEGEHTIYIEGPVGSGAKWWGPPDVVVTAPDGSRVTVRHSNLTSSYVWNGLEGTSIGEFTADESGAYSVTVLGEPSSNGVSVGYKVAIGETMGFGHVGQIVGSIALGGLSFLVATIVLIVTIVRHAKARRRQGPGTGQYPGPQYPGQQYPGPQYPGPQYPGPQYPGGFPPAPQPGAYPQQPPQQYPGQGTPWQPPVPGSQPQPGPWPQQPPGGWSR